MRTNRYMIVDDIKMCVPHAEDYIRYKEGIVSILGRVKGEPDDCEVCDNRFHLMIEEAKVRYIE